MHSKSIRDRTWTVGNASVDELYELQNLDVIKNYAGSFSTNVDDSIQKARKKAGMLLSANLDHRKTCPLVHVKFWKQTCLLVLLFGSELFSVTPSLLLKLERCQSWLLRKIFHAPKFAPGILLLLIDINLQES